jgi:hypothetical protein
MQHGRFFFNLGLLGAAVLLIVASIAFGPGAVRGVGLGIGSAGVVTSLWFIAATMHQRPLDGYRELGAFGMRAGLWSLLAGVTGAVATWEIVQVVVFAPTPAKWLTLANGLVVGTLACAGLVAHEVSSERVVHCLEVVQRHEL